MAEQMYLVEALRARKGDRPAAIARFILTAGSRYSALSKLRVYYDTDDLDSLTATPISGIIPIAGSLAAEMLRRPASPAEGPQPQTDDEGEGWKGPE
ncbi:MAG TPA: hypothetical protein VEI06_05600 [Gemmatimonadaceae bacterium]|nr:hypothetical protein [Gemmatimonadaceae bacterium]